MTPNRFQQIRNLFEAALERDPPDRATFLADACQDDQELRDQVRRLLEAHESTTAALIETRPEQRVPVRTDPASREGRRIGDYEILRELGRGGMGSVYLARRADEAFQKNVAIKILRPDAAILEVVQRFHREREILAQLDHPNIARLLDAGETDDGLPYFVMEYVEGRSIKQYADDNRLRVWERVALFRQVCDAVDYAHQRKVVHRDLKPGNVLVTADGQGKLLDFGIARLIEQDGGAVDLTRSGMWLMTPEYASPEQVRGEAAGRASDVYSLGVILFELLTGHRPYHLRSRIFHEIVRVVCEEPPTRPSAVVVLPIEITTGEGKPATLPPETAGRLRQTSLEELKRQLTGDLDNILLKALDKQPQHRYGSAQQLRADVDRYLNGEPVWALGDSHLPQIGRLLSRYRVPLVIVAALAAAVATGTVQMQWSVLWWAAGAAALLGLWHAARDPAAGRRIAGSWLMSGRSWIVILAILDVLWIIGPHWIGQVLMAGCTLVCIVLVSARLTRRRWSGPLVLDLSNVGVVRFLAILGPLGWWRTLTSESGDTEKLLKLLFFTAWTIFFLVGVGSEIRRDGFIRGGRLISWGRIASWTWDSNVLVLHLYRRIQFLPPVRIRMRPPQKAQVEAILARQLSEWPVQVERTTTM